MSFNTLRFRQTPFRNGDKLVFKSSGRLPLFDIHVNTGDYFLRSEPEDNIYTWRLHDEQEKLFHKQTYTDVQIRQMLGHKGFDSYFEDTVILSDNEGEELLKKFEEKSW